MFWIFTEVINMQFASVQREIGFIGYNDTLAPEFLPPGMLADALNCFMRSQQIVKRNGYTIIGDDLGSNGCQGLKGVRFASGTTIMYGVFNGTIYLWTGSGSWTASTGSYTLSTTAQIWIEVANNAVYFFDGTNVVVKHDGATATTVAAIPIGTKALWFHNQLHVIGMSGNPNRLQSSEIGNPEVFAGGNSSSLDVNPNDGDFIVDLNILKDELIIFKRNRIWSMTGFGSSALTLNDLSERQSGFGGISIRGSVNTGNDVIYLGFLGDRPIIRSLMRTREGFLYDAGNLSASIETTMNGLNKAQLAKAATAFDGRYAWFAVADGSSTTNSLVLTLDTETMANAKMKMGWTRHKGINAAVFDVFSISGTAQMYFGEATADSKAYVFDTSTSDNGTAINFMIKTRRYGGVSPELKKKYKWLYVTAKESGNYDVDIDYSTDGFDFADLGTLNLTGTGSIFNNIVLDQSRLGTTDIKRDRYTVPKSRQYYTQFRFQDTSATSVVTLRDWELYFGLRHAIDTRSAVN